MPDNDTPGTPPVADIQARLREVAESLRQSPAVDAASREALAELLDELSAALGPAPPSPEVAHLAQTAAHVAESLHQHHDRSRLAEARDRLEQAVLAAEARAPFTAGLIHRLLDILAAIGV